MAKATTIKEALARWEEKTSQKPSEAKEVKLYAQIPPIEKMDASLSMLANCEKLSLSTNCIEKIANLNGLKNLRILSLGRNNIKNLNGLYLFLVQISLKRGRECSAWLFNAKNSHTAYSSPARGQEAVGDTLEELWISYNFIEKLKGIHVMKKLKILYMSNNQVKDWAEFVKLAELPCLEDLVFVGNPLEEKHSAEGNWIEEATKRVPKLKKLDGTPVIKQDEEEEN
uniref:Dynein axonemal light chain 1 n=2 Tax=Pipistrellus kuhlii TaxID=59472 RepID=A0A7J8AZT7_PIPKU|nr:dynein axonemal light chain 1 [Pipistrellus kuhlii]